MKENWVCLRPHSDAQECPHVLARQRNVHNESLNRNVVDGDTLLRCKLFQIVINFWGQADQGFKLEPPQKRKVLLFGIVKSAS